MVDYVLYIEMVFQEFNIYLFLSSEKYFNTIIN